MTNKASSSACTVYICFDNINPSEEDKFVLFQNALALVPCELKKKYGKENQASAFNNPLDGNLAGWQIRLLKHKALFSTLETVKSL